MSSTFKEIFESYLENEIAEYSSSSLFEPFIYSMQNKGKRVRPVLTLMAADSIANNFEKALIKTLDKIEGSSSIVGININQPKKYLLLKKAIQAD